MKAGVIGCGRWGSFIAWYLEQKGIETVLYGRMESRRFIQLQATGENDLVKFSGRVGFSSDLEALVKDCDILFISIATSNFRKLAYDLNQCSGIEGKRIVLCMKGLEEKTGLRLSEIARGEIMQRVRIAVWVGPGHVQDFVAGRPNCMVIDSEDKEFKAQLVKMLSGELIRFYYGTDLLGNEVGAAAKNVIGIAAGLLDGLGKESLKGALISRGSREIGRLIAAMGGNELTAYGLAHLGDYAATVFSPYSHNRMFGEKFAKGEPYGELAEGVYTAKALMVLSAQYGEELPICSGVYDAIYNHCPVEEVIAAMFSRLLKNEF